MTEPAAHADRVLDDALARLVEAVLRHATLLAQTHNVLPVDLRAVGTIERAGGLRPGELARALGLSSSGTTAVIHRLRAAGLVDRDHRTANHRDLRLQVASGAHAALGLAPGRQLPAACDAAGLGVGERELIATFALRLLELIERDTDAIGAALARPRDDLPLPPRWA